MKAIVMVSSLVTAALLPSTAYSQELLAPLVDGRINVVDDGLKPPFIRDQQFFPGETVELKIDFRVDPMRRMHEDRECWSDWFGGIDCHYVQRSDASGLPASQVPLTLSLRKDNLIPDVAPAMVKDSPHDTELQFPPSTGTFKFTLNITEPQLSARFSQGYSLVGRVAPKYGNPPALAPIDRRACSPFRNGQYCSQGEYVITINSVDTRVRLEMLNAWLSSTNRNARDVTASIDSWMLFKIRPEDGKLEANTNDREKIAASLLQHVESYYQVVTGKVPSPERLPILELARRINPNNPSIASAIVRTQIASGDILSALAENKQNIATFQTQYDSGARTEPVLRGYAEALSNAASILRARSFDLNPGDVRQAADYFNQSAIKWSEYAVLENADLENGNRQYIAARMEQSKAGARVSDLIPLPDSIAAMVDARSRLPREQEGIAAAVGNQGSLLIVDDHFSSVGKDGNTQIALAFLPSDTRHIADIDSQGGRLLAKVGEKAPLVLVDVLKRTSTTLPEDVYNGIVYDNGLLTTKEKKLFRVVDGSSTEVTAIDDDYLWAVARGKGTIAIVKRTVSDITIIDSDKTTTLPAPPLSEISAIALSRDGKKLIVEGRATAKRQISTFDVASSSVKTWEPKKTTLSAGLFLNTDATRAVLWHSDGTLEVLDTSTGVTVEPELGPLNSKPVQLSGNEIAIASGSSGEATRNLLVVALDKVTNGPREAQPEGGIRSVKLDVELPPDMFLPFSPNSSPNSLIFATTAIGTAKSPVVARIMDGSGKVSGDVAVTDWHPHEAFPIGDAIGINPVGSNWARIVSTDGSPMQVFKSGVGERTVLVPVGEAQAYFLITFSSTNSARSAQFYSTPKASPQTVDIEQTSNSKWELLLMPGGPLSHGQQHIALIDRPDPASNKEIGLATFNTDGEYWIARKEIENPGEIVDILPEGKGYLRHIAESFVFEGSNGSSATLADCGSRINCAIDVYQPSVGHYVVALKADRALEVTDWNLSETPKSDNCIGCDRFDFDAAKSAGSRLPYGFGTSGFSLGNRDDTVLISFPTAKTLLTSKFDGKELVSKPGGGMPLYADASGLLIQAGPVVQQWKNPE
ncbi:hypothetical protein [Rhizobium leguminosarum]